MSEIKKIIFSKKHFLIAVAVVVIFSTVFSLAGCGSGKSGSSDTAGSSAGDSSSAEEETETRAAGDTDWSYEDGVLTISGTGAMEDYEPEGTPWYSYVDEIETLVIEEGITYIGDYSFYACTAMTTMTIPDSVTEIGAYAFAFCESISGLTLSDSITEIGDWAFYCCASLISITLPDELGALGSGTFAYCTSLASITIPDSVSSIGDYCFYCCNTINEITVPANVSSIGEKVFSFCTSLDYIYADSENEDYTDEDGVLFTSDMETLVAYPGGNEDADDYEYDIPDSVTAIAAGAFEGNNWLSYINIPAGVTEIGEDAFNAGYWFEEINVDSDNPNYSSEDGILYDKNQTELIMYPMGKNDMTVYEIPDTVVTIGNYAFYMNLYLEELIIPESVTEIGDYALYITYSLSNIYYEGSEDDWNSVSISDANDLSSYNFAYDY